MSKISKFMKNHVGSACVVLSILLIVSIILCVGIGPVSIPFSTVWQIILHKLTGWELIGEIENKTINIVWFLRVPRVLLGALVGSSLSLSGVAMQAFTRNPLASPYILGTSSGASFGAALAIATGALAFLGTSATPIGAFAGSLLSILIVYRLAKNGKEVAPIRLVLVGSAVSAMFSAFSNFIVYKAPDDSKVKAVTFWMLGSVATAEWTDLLPILLVLIPGIIVLFILSSSLNALLMGESSAVTLGVNINRVRKITIFISALMTGVTVAASGCIGFVGLVVPHIVRSLVGADHHKVVPISALLGAIYMVWVDVGARMLDAPGEIPIGIITSIIGAPLFLWMLKSRKYTFGK